MLLSRRSPACRLSETARSLPFSVTADFALLPILECRVHCLGSRHVIPRHDNRRTNKTASKMSASNTELFHQPQCSRLRSTGRQIDFEYEGCVREHDFPWNESYAELGSIARKLESAEQALALWRSTKGGGLLGHWRGLETKAPWAPVSESTIRLPLVCPEEDRPACVVCFSVRSSPV